MKAFRPTFLVALLAVLAVLAGGLALFAYRSLSVVEQAPFSPAVASAPVATGEPLLPLPAAEPQDPRKVALGERLFHDPRLSHDGTVACASCHRLAGGGGDGRSRSAGIRGQEGAVNAPTVFNSALNFRQFWDGRAASLEEQVDGPVNNPLEMGSNWGEAVARLEGVPAYGEEFRALYGAVSAAAVRDAIAAFERTLLTPSRFDRYLRGEADAITADERAGYGLFKRYGCVACHQGANVGGNMFQRFGVMEDYFTGGRKPGPSDLGRYNVTGLEEDRYVFKVPSLRNVARTAPYFHNGAAATLDEAVRIMGRSQLGIELSATDVHLIVAFLNALTGEYRGKPL